MLIKKLKSERHQIKKFLFVYFLRIIMDPSLPVLSEEEKSEVTPPLETVPTPTAAQLWKKMLKNAKILVESWYAQGEAT